MKMKCLFVFGFGIFTCTNAPLLSAAELSEQARRNWPQWRGPKATGVAPQAAPPTSWSETERVKWKAKLPGFGTSTPIVWEDQVFVLTAIPTAKKAEDTAVAPPAPPAPVEAAPPGNAQGGRRRGGGMRSETPTDPCQFAVVALDRKSGEVRWQKAVRQEVPHEGHHRDHGFASASPVTDGENLYVSFGSRGVHCLDLQGNVKWQKDLGKMVTRNAFGEGASLALHAETLVVSWDHEGEDFIYRLGQEIRRGTLAAEAR